MTLGTWIEVCAALAIVGILIKSFNKQSQLLLAGCAITLTMMGCAKAETYPFYPLGSTALHGETLSEHGVMGPLGSLAYETAADSGTIDGHKITILSHAPNAIAPTFGWAGSSARFEGSYNGAGSVAGIYRASANATYNFQGAVDANAAAGTFSFSTLRSLGKVEHQLMATGPGKWHGQLVFDMSFGTDPEWETMTDIWVEARVQGSRVKWTWEPPYWVADGQIYQAIVHPVTGERHHSFQIINDDTEPPVEGFANFPSGKTYFCSGWVSSTQGLLYGVEVNGDWNTLHETEYGSGTNKLFSIGADAKVVDEIKD